MPTVRPSCSWATGCAHFHLKTGMTGTVLLCSVCLTTPTPPLSMGGAIAVHIASRELLGPCLIGLVVIDVVEGALV